MPSAKDPEMQPPQRPLSIAALAEQLQRALDAARAENESLIQQNQQAEDRAATAEKHATEIQTKLAILEDLKTKQYQTVVTELFEGPSKAAATLTLKIAVVSIIASLVIGITQMVVSNLISIRDNARTQNQLVQSLSSRLSGEILASEKRTGDHIADALKRSEAAVLDLSPVVPNLLPNTPLKIRSSGEDLYFKISISPRTPLLFVSLKPLDYDSDLNVRYGSLPGSGINTKTGNSCNSDRSGLVEDHCSIENPRPGDWFVRIHPYKKHSAAAILEAKF